MQYTRKRPSRAAALTRLFKRKATSRFTKGKQLFTQLTTINDLKSEIEMLTSYSTDTIYRLRYNSMRYDYISPAVTRLLGYTPEEMKKTNIRKLIVETRIVTDGMRAVESFTGLEENRKRGDVDKWQADYLIRTKDGRKIWISDVSFPWFDINGSIIGSVGSLRDITDRIEAEAKVKEELVRIANTDSLTGIANRRAFFARIEDELKRVRRSRGEVCILLIDIDEFKKINDSYGHDVGDSVIIGVTKIINSCLRETDLAGRLGGEEFGAILTDTPSDGAYWVAERIRASIAKHVFYAGSERRPLGCTVSIGVSSSKLNDSFDATKLYKLADSRLYIAKHAGRNQVSIEELVNNVH